LVNIDSKLTREREKKIEIKIFE